MLLDILTSPLFGGLTGAVASYFQKKQELECLKEKNAHELSMTEMRSVNRINEIEAQSDADDKRIEAQSFLESLKSVPSWGDTIKSSVRVVVTFYLLGWVTYVGHELTIKGGGIQALSEGVATDLMTKIIYAVVYLTVTCVTWWYGQRPSQTFRMMGAVK